MSDEWYYAKNGQQMGPVSTDVITRMAAAGQVQANDLVWREGMPNWAPARTVRAIFPESPQAVAVPVPPTRREAYPVSPEPVADVAPAPHRREQTYEEPEEEDWDRPRPRRRRRKGNPTLLIVGISVGVLVVIGLIVLVVVLLIPGNPRSFNLRSNEKYECNVEFKAGQKAQIWVSSDQDSDVDLFVYNRANQVVRFDDGPSKDCYVEFVPARTETYKIVVWNRVLDPRMMQQHRNRSNHCTLKWSPP